MAETSDYDPGPWKGYDFSAARSSYDAHAGRSYDDAVKGSVDPLGLVPDKVSTDSPSPVVIACDVTGQWPTGLGSFSQNYPIWILRGNLIWVTK